MMNETLSMKERGASSEVRRRGLPITIAGVEEWLRGYGIVGPDVALQTYSDLDEWHPGGSESYVCSFEINVTNGAENRNYRLIIKALTTLTPSASLAVWTRRRRLLANNAVPVSNWRWSGNAMIIEDFYPSDYTKTREPALLKAIAEKLDVLGFCCLHFLGDIRCDAEGNPFYVDFGSDLGDPSSSRSNRAMLQFERVFGKVDGVENG